MNESTRVSMSGKSKKYNKDHEQWIDISLTLKSGMVHWPGDPEVIIELESDITKNEKCNVSRITMSSHTGTHIDAPFHYIEEGTGIDQMPIDAMKGIARVIEISDPESVKKEELIDKHITKGERILFKTTNSEKCWKSGEFVKDYVYVDTDAAEFLAEKEVLTIGVDYLSVGSMIESGEVVHKILLSSGIWVIEGLDLSAVNTGSYDFICMPLKIQHGDGAPARAIIRNLEID